MYFFNHEEVAAMFTNFGYPTYIIYPYATAKLLGLLAMIFLIISYIYSKKLNKTV